MIAVRIEGWIEVRGIDRVGLLELGFRSESFEDFGQSVDSFGTIPASLGRSPKLGYQGGTRQGDLGRFRSLCHQTQVFLLGVHHEPGRPITVAYLWSESLQCPTGRRTACQGLDENRGIDLKSLGQRHGFAYPQQVHGSHDLIAQLDPLSGPERTAMRDVLSHGLEDRLGRLKIARVAPRENTQCRVLSTDGPTGHRSFQEPETHPLQLFSDLDRHPR